MFSPMPLILSTSPCRELPNAASLSRRNQPCRQRSLTVLALVGLLGGGPSLGCAQEVEPELTVRDFDVASVRMMVESLGKMTAADVKKRRAKGDIDGVAQLPDGTCDGPCHFAQLDVYIKNDDTTPIAPPVLRLDAPKGRPARRAVSFRGHEISPRREGRIRWLVALYPEEERISAHLSSSVFFDLSGTGSSGPGAKPVEQGDVQATGEGKASADSKEKPAPTHPSSPTQ